MLGWISIRAAAKTAAFENPVVTGGGKVIAAKVQLMVYSRLITVLARYREN
jgi:hypothetical protein